jgi:hypothetical protein
MNDLLKSNSKPIEVEEPNNLSELMDDRQMSEFIDLLLKK